MYVYELENSSLPEVFVSLLPKTCDTCGEYTEITESLTILKCSNPNCGGKSVQRLVTLLQDLGVKNMGESRCQQFLDNFNVNNPYIIFMYEPSDGPLYEGCSMDFSEGIYEQIDERRTMLLWEYVRIGNLPGIRDSARKLLSDYDSLEEFYDDLEAGGIPFVQELLGIKVKKQTDDFFDDDEDTLSVKAVQTYNTLIYFKEDLFEALDYVDIKALDTPVLNLCISTAVGKPYKSKKDFIDSMNSLFSSKVHLNFLGSVSKDIQFLIWSKEGAKTSKVRKVEALNEKAMAYNYENGLDEDTGIIHIMTGEEFEEYLDTF